MVNFKQENEQEKIARQRVESAATEARREKLVAEHKLPYDSSTTTATNSNNSFEQAEATKANQDRIDAQSRYNNAVNAGLTQAEVDAQTKIAAQPSYPADYPAQVVTSQPVNYTQAQLDEQFRLAAQKSAETEKAKVEAAKATQASKATLPKVSKQ